MEKGNLAKKMSMVTKKEKSSYGSYFIGQNIYYLLLYMFLVPYFTDIGIPAASVAVLTLIVKAWDAINDPIFGGIVDRVKFKKGKFLPWLKVSLLAIPASTILLFAIPASLPVAVKITWAAVAYILWDTAYTICDVPIFGIVTTMTDEQQERTSLLTIGRMSALIAALMVSVVVPMLKGVIGGWLPTTIVLSVIAIISMIPICLTANERIEPKAAEKETTVKEMFSFLRQNKYMLIFFGAILIIQSAGIGNSMGLYTARYLLGNEALMTLTSLVPMLPMLLIGFFVPAIVKRVDKYYLFLWANIATVVISAVLFFVGYSNMTLYLVMLILRGIPVGITSILMFMFTPDCAEYGCYKSGISAPGISFSIQTFTSKLTAALATSLGAACLAAIGFVEGEGAVQTAGFTDRFWAVTVWVPVVGAILGIIVLSFYKLRDNSVQIMAKCNAGEISREDAAKALEGKL